MRSWWAEGEQQQLADKGGSEELVAEGEQQQLADKGDSEEQVAEGEQQQLADKGDSEELVAEGEQQQLADKGGSEELATKPPNRKYISYSLLSNRLFEEYKVKQRLTEVWVTSHVTL